MEGLAGRRNIAKEKEEDETRNILPTLHGGKRGGEKMCRGQRKGEEKARDTTIAITVKAKRNTTSGGVDWWQEESPSFSFPHREGAGREEGIGRKGAKRSFINEALAQGKGGLSPQKRKPKQKKAGGRKRTRAAGRRGSGKGKGKSPICSSKTTRALNCGWKGTIREGANSPVEARS